MFTRDILSQIFDIIFLNIKKNRTKKETENLNV